MVSALFLVIISHAILFSFLFWIITIICKYFYSSKYQNYKLNFYECGFKSLSTIKIQYNINFILLILFILLYDGEFLILTPYALNITLHTFTTHIVLLFFIIWLLWTLIFDYIYSTLEWQI